MSERTLLNELTGAVTTWFQNRAASFGLHAEHIEARYILNWGGFVNASFTITDGKTSYHLKLADDEWSQSCLEQWHELNELLSREYHAPRMLDWVEVPGTGFAGPLFEYIPGEPLDLVNQPILRQQVLDFLARLHSDSQLADLLAEEAESPNCADYFLSVYIDRFDEDLRTVAGELPPFVSLHLLDWMMGETRELEGLARSLPAFQVPASSPTHGDLWTSNILVSTTGSWYVIDWDDLALGDPALEYAIFLGPLWRRDVLSIAEVENMLPADPALRERFRLSLRAFLLDEVIDSLADWVECTFAPELVAQVRAGKEQVHTKALERYQQLFD
jgi:Ser/Thr protein kinase RdoA (MazF antagonist)